MRLLLLLDTVVAALLVATIAFCLALNRRLNRLRRDEAELKRVLASFNEAAARAEAGIAKLKEAGGEVDAALRQRIEEARAIHDELAFAAARGDRLVSRLSAFPAASDPPRRRADAPAAPRGPSRAERELLRALERAR